MIAIYIWLFMGFSVLHVLTVEVDTSEASSLSTNPTNITTLGPISTTDITNTTLTVSSTTFVSTTDTPLTTTPPVAPEGFWNTSCIQARMTVGFSIEGNSGDNFYVFSNVYDDRSSCNVSNQYQELILDHPQTGNIPEYSLALVFEKNATNVFVRNITFNYVNNQTGKERFYNDEVHFMVKTGNSFFCQTPLNISFFNVTMHVYNIRLQAFLTAEDNGFGPAEMCPCLDCVNDLVAIVIACVLASVIILVFISYLIGRSRFRQKGYLSV